MKLKEREVGIEPATSSLGSVSFRRPKTYSGLDSLARVSQSPGQSQQWVATEAGSLVRRGTGHCVECGVARAGILGMCSSRNQCDR
jgi:hypothetical protein